MINAAALKDSAYLVALLFHFAEVELLKRAGNDLVVLSEIDRDAQIVKARQLLAYEQYAARVLDGTHDLVVRELMELVNAAEEAGRYSAVADLRQLGYQATIMPQQVEAVQEIAREMIAAVNQIPARALRASLDAFMEAQAYATGTTALGALTRREASQVMMERLADQGISGFRDRAGRWWRADTYTEMAVRTGTMNVVTTAALHTYEENGVGYVQVSDSSYECGLCRPYEGKILAIDSRTPTGPVETGDMLTGGRTTFTVTATVDYAKADGLLHPNCFPSGTLVQTTDSVDASDARWYEGDLVIIETASGDQLSVTPNHPILTPEGWVEAGALREGMNVLRHNDWAKTKRAEVPHEVHVPTRIGDVHRALKESGTVATVSMPVTTMDFHGDGTVNTEVEIVLRDRLLQNDPMLAFPNSAGENSLSARRMSLRPLLTEGTSLKVDLCPLHATDSVMSVPHDRGSLLGSHAGGPLHSGGGAVSLDPVIAKRTRNRGLTSSDDLPDLGLSVAPFVPEADGLSVPGGRRLVPGTERGGLGDGAANTGGAEALLDVRLADIEGGRELGRTLSSEVSASQIIKINRRNFAGHVYNLETSNHWYIAESIIVHNCTHSLDPFIPGATREDPPLKQDWETYQASQHQRSLERDYRRWIRREAAATTDLAKTEALHAINAIDDEIETLVNQYPKLIRKPHRESPFTAR